MPLRLNDPTLLRRQAFIGGVWCDSDSGDTYAVNNPATGGLICEVASCGTAETAKAITVAHKAQSGWAAKSAKERHALLMKWHNLIQANVEDLAVLLTSEQGKPIAEARGEILYGANYIQWFAEEAKRMYGDTIPSLSNDQRLIVLKQPIGVVACITPWNFPNAMLARKIAPAIAAGNTVVCKPANETPLSAFAIAELAQRAGIPDGVINLVSGRTAEIGEEITSNPIVRKLTFTGSTPVGKKLTADAARTMKRTSMELGGNAPFIVFEDADIDSAVAGLMASKFRNAGQTCVCTNRIFIHEKIHASFVEKLTAAMSELRIGLGMEDGVHIGPLIHKIAADKVRGLIQEAVSSGARVQGLALPEGLPDNFVAPVILTDVTPDMRVINEEVFGPVAPIIQFSSEQEVIELANDTPFGLAAYIYCRDIGRVWRVSEALEFGMVGINVGIMANEMAPFGGMKESGQGREGSKYGLDDYLEIKSLCMGGLA